MSKSWLLFLAAESPCYLHNLEEPKVILYPSYNAVCGRDCFTADCGISPHDFDDVIDDANDYEQIDEGETKLDVRILDASNEAI